MKDDERRDEKDLDELKSRLSGARRKKSTAEVLLENPEIKEVVDNISDHIVEISPVETYPVTKETKEAEKAVEKEMNTPRTPSWVRRHPEIIFPLMLLGSLLYLAIVIWK